MWLDLRFFVSSLNHQKNERLFVEITKSIKKNVTVVVTLLTTITFGDIISFVRIKEAFSNESDL